MGTREGGRNRGEAKTSMRREAEKRTLKGGAPVKRCAKEIVVSFAFFAVAGGNWQGHKNWARCVKMRGGGEVIKDKLKPTEGEAPLGRG